MKPTAAQASAVWDRMGSYGGHKERNLVADGVVYPLGSSDRLKGATINDVRSIARYVSDSVYVPNLMRGNVDEAIPLSREAEVDQIVLDTFNELQHLNTTSLTELQRTMTASIQLLLAPDLREMTEYFDTAKPGSRLNEPMKQLVVTLSQADIHYSLSNIEKNKQVVSAMKLEDTQIAFSQLRKYVRHYIRVGDRRCTYVHTDGRENVYVHNEEGAYVAVRKGIHFIPNNVDNGGFDDPEKNIGADLFPRLVASMEAYTTRINENGPIHGEKKYGPFFYEGPEVTDGQVAGRVRLASSLGGRKWMEEGMGYDADRG